MLGRRRRRQQEKKKKDNSPTAIAHLLIQEEISNLQKQVQSAKEETLQKRQHYQQQECELRTLYEQAQKQLQQRRDTLLATTSLIPYTKTIQQTHNFRVPAPILTLQARLCLHVHCLCIHEELLLQTKEQGWDTIAWMEDVSRQLRLVTYKQLVSWQSKIQQQVTELQQQQQQQSNNDGNDKGVEIPLDIQQTLQQDYSSHYAIASSGGGGGGDGDDDNYTMDETITPTSAATQGGFIMNQETYALPGSDHHDSKPPQRRPDESFSEFLKRYEQRKEHQQKADQMRLAEFRSRGNTTAKNNTNRGGGGGAGGVTASFNGSSQRGENPYTSRRAVVGKKLKQYASKLLFQGSQEGEDDDDDAAGHSKGINNAAADLDEIQSEHVNSPRMMMTDDSSFVDDSHQINVQNSERRRDSTDDESTPTNNNTESGGGGNRIRPRKWISAVKNRSTSLLLMGSQSESNVHSNDNDNDTDIPQGWRPGSNIRKLRSRLGRRNTTTNIPSNTTTTKAAATTATLTELREMETPAELSHGESSCSSEDVEGNEKQDNNNAKEGADANANGGTPKDNNNNNIDDDDEQSIGQDELIESNRSSDQKESTANTEETPQEKNVPVSSSEPKPVPSPIRNTIMTAPSSKLKSKLQAPVTPHKFHESANW